MPELHEFGIWLPGPGIVADNITVRFAPGQLWAVVGRSGSGASVLLRAMAGRLPATARTRGALALHHSSVLHVGALPPLGVAEYLGGLAGRTALVPGRYDADAHLDHRTTSVPPDVRAGLLLAALERAPRRDLVLVDACLTAASAHVRDAFGAELRRRTRDGACVLWADHALDTLMAHATHVLELGLGRQLAAEPAPSWVPVSLPPLLRRPAGASARRVRGSATIVSADRLDLDGAAVEVPAGATVGIVRRGGRPEPFARRLVSALGGKVLSSHARRGRALSVLDGPDPLWLPHPQAGLDPHDRLALATHLAGQQPAPRGVTGRDWAFLADACHEIVVIDGDRVRTQGTPRAVESLVEGGVIA